MHTPADRTAKRISVQEWFVRSDAVELATAAVPTPRAPRRQMQPPADRVAVRT